METWLGNVNEAPEDVVVETRICDSVFGERNVQPLRRRGRLWWTPDCGMYVYYTPTHWRPLSSGRRK